MNKMIGLGTGRCGTVTLTNLINIQKDFRATHETFHKIASWKFNDSYFNKLEEYIISGSSDISFYNLPYTTKLLNIFPDLKCVCLKRNKEETVKSYMKKTARNAVDKPRNHWTNRNSKYWNETDWRLDPIWDKCYPKFEFPKKESIEAYWNLYYEEAERLESNYPNNFKVFDMYEVLNYEECQSELLSFIGIKEENKKFLLKEKMNIG